MAEARRLIIIGSGPAGYAAAIYAARAQLKPLVLAGEKGGGQLMLTTEVENYPGFADGVMGPSLMMTMREQAIRFGAEIIDHDVTRVDLSSRPFKVWSGHHTHMGDEVHVHQDHIDEVHALPKTEHQTKEEMEHEDFDKAEAIILATGAESIPLGVPGEREYSGRGVSYCAVCDAAFFRERRVFVVGGGDAAMEDSLALLKFAKKITILHRRDTFRASKIMQERVLSDKEKVDVWWNSEVVEVKGDGQKIGSIMIKNSQSKEVNEERAEGLFVAIGHNPATGFLDGQVALDEKGYVKTGITYPFEIPVTSDQEPKFHLWRQGYPTMTSVEGVFAGGDNIDFRYRQAATAAGMGVQAALDAEWWLERR